MAVAPQLKARSDSWQSPADPETTFNLLVTVTQERGGRILTSDGTRARIALGSRRMYRFLGALSPVRTRPLQLDLDVSSADNGGSRITAQAESDQGWYLVDVKSLSTPQFDRAFDDLFSHLREAAPPT
jgi:hypothetical protein